MTKEIIKAAEDALKLYAVGDRPEGTPPPRKLTIGSLYIFYKPKNTEATNNPRHFIKALRKAFETGAV